VAEESPLRALIDEVKWASLNLYDAEDKKGLEIHSKEWARRWDSLGLSIEKLMTFVGEHDYR
jgi:hypothetical protein